MTLGCCWSFLLSSDCFLNADCGCSRVEVGATASVPIRNLATYALVGGLSKIYQPGGNSFLQMEAIGRDAKATNRSEAQSKILNPSELR